MDVDMLHIIWLKTQAQIHVQRKKAQILEIDNRKKKVKKVYCEKTQIQIQISTNRESVVKKCNVSKGGMDAVG